MALNWHDAVKLAIRRYSEKNKTIVIERSKFLEQELATIVLDTNSSGATPAQTLSRVLQELRDEGILYFTNAGLYTLNHVSVDVSNEDLAEDILENLVNNNSLILPDVKTSDEQGSLRLRRGMSALRKSTLTNYGYECALCDITDEKLLVTSHIVRWSDNPETRGLLSNTICFCNFHDRLFETGYFAFDADSNLIWKTAIVSKAISTWRDRFSSHFKKPKFYMPSPTFLAEHRQRVGL